MAYKPEELFLMANITIGAGQQRRYIFLVQVKDIVLQGDVLDIADFAGLS